MNSLSDLSPGILLAQNTVPLWIGAFAKLWEATVSFVMSVRLYTCNNSATTGRIFAKFDVLSIFRKTVETIQFSLKSDHNNLYFTWSPIYILIISRSVLLRMRNVSDKSCRGKQNTNFVSHNCIFFRKSCRSRENVEKFWTTGQAIDNNMAHALGMLDN
jgi:hypothetical protein